MKFKLISSLKPEGDQPKAITQLTDFLNHDAEHALLLGVTGSGKTFTVANVIKNIQRPTLVISHNKTLAAQLYQELKEFFPKNSVHYFVSYYDYYQPEAYIPQTNTYIEKDAKINDLIDSLRHAATASILSRQDTIIVASVSCIYGLGNPEEYKKASIEIQCNQLMSPQELTKKLTTLQYKRNSIDPKRGEFRVRGDAIEITTPSNEEIIRIEFSATDKEKTAIMAISIRRPDIHAPFYPLHTARIFPAKHFVPPQKKLAQAIKNIRTELRERLVYLKKEGKLLEAQRLEERTRYDLEMIKEMGYAPGIENYSRHLDFREPGEPPYTLIDYFKKTHHDFLTVIDESHASIPQIRGMYAGDKSRKETLIAYGFRLPSALDNRPLTFDECTRKIGPILYVSSTPAEYELKKSGPYIAEQIIRPTGLLDPEIEVRETKNQIRDVIEEIKKRSSAGERSLVLTLTKRLAEDITDFLKENGIKTEYLHSDIKTLERPEILKNLRMGNFDALVGINLLREGLDLPEVSFIAILDADKEGFLRNKTTLLQMIGRAARHLHGKVILYGDTITKSMRVAIDTTEERRKIQHEHNMLHGIVPRQIVKGIRKSILSESEAVQKNKEGDVVDSKNSDIKKIISALELEIKRASKEMNFELAAKIRDRVEKLSTKDGFAFGGKTADAKKYPKEH